MHHRFAHALLALTVPAWPAFGQDEQSDPFLGDWQGESLVAQVIPRGDGSYQINLLPEFDVKCEPLAVVHAQLSDAAVRFEQDGWTGELSAEYLFNWIVDLAAKEHAI